MPIASNGYSTCKQETSKNKGRGNLVSLWMQTTVLPLSELCWGWDSERMSPVLLTDDTTEGESKLARGREEGEAPLWVYKFMLYPWPNPKLCRPCSCLLIHPSLYPPSSSFPSASAHRTCNVSLNGQRCSLLDPEQSNASIPNPCLSSKNTWTHLVINRYLCCD